MPFRTVILALAFALAALAPQRVIAAEEPLLVFAAASLKGALDDVAGTWDGDVTISYAGSAALARQIEQGAPADIIISANLDWMDRLERRGHLRVGTKRRLLGNRLVLISSDAEHPLLTLSEDLDLIGELGTTGVLAMALPNAVPAGIYGKAALSYFGLWDGVASRVAGAENVRMALTFVARGEAPLGIVYVTDAMSEPRVKVVAEFPAQSHPEIIYPAAVIAGSDHPDAQAFLDYLASARAAAQFRAAGFETVN